MLILFEDTMIIIRMMIQLLKCVLMMTRQKNKRKGKFEESKGCVNESDRECEWVSEWVVNVNDSWYPSWSDDGDHHLILSISCAVGPAWSFFFFSLLVFLTSCMDISALCSTSSEECDALPSPHSPTSPHRPDSYVYNRVAVICWLCIYTLLLEMHVLWNNSIMEDPTPVHNPLSKWLPMCNYQSYDTLLRQQQKQQQQQQQQQWQRQYPVFMNIFQYLL